MLNWIVCDGVSDGNTRTRPLLRRSRKGCATCKIRKIKCDETPPACRNCLKTGRTCDGPGVNERSRSTTRPTVLPLEHLLATQQKSRNGLTPSDVDELYYLNYYFDVVARTIGSGFDLEFWSRQIHVYVHKDRSVRYAVMAISVLSKHGNPNNRLPCEQARLNLKDNNQDINVQKAMTWYGEALQQAGQQGYETTGSTTSSQDIGMTVLKCLLFLAIELLLGNARNVLRLGDVAFQLLTTIEHIQAEDEILVSAVPILNRFSAALSIYGYRIPDNVRAVAASCKIRLEKGVSRSWLLSLRDQLTDIVYQAHCLWQGASVVVTMEYKHERKKLLSILEEWQKDLKSCCEQSDTANSPAQRILILSLKMLYTTIKVQLQCYHDETSMLYDNHHEDFLAILSNAEAIISLRRTTSHAKFSFEFGYIPCVHFVAWQCRRRETRNRAIDLLQSLDSQQCLWTSIGMYNVSAAVAKLEELNGVTLPLREGSGDRTGVMRRFRAGVRIGLSSELPDMDAGEYSILFRYRTYG